MRTRTCGVGSIGESEEQHHNANVAWDFEHVSTCENRVSWCVWVCVRVSVTERTHTHTRSIRHITSCDDKLCMSVHASRAISMERKLSEWILIRIYGDMSGPRVCATDVRLSMRTKCTNNVARIRYTKHRHTYTNTSSARIRKITKPHMIRDTCRLID